MYNHHDFMVPTHDIFRSSNRCVSLYIEIGERIEIHSIGSVLENVRLSMSAMARPLCSSQAHFVRQLNSLDDSVELVRCGSASHVCESRQSAVQVCAVRLKLDGTHAARIVLTVLTA